MSKCKLSKEEKALLDAVEAGEFESVLTEARKKELVAIAGFNQIHGGRQDAKFSNHLEQPSNNQRRHPGP
jgi:hypothetical protein